jgi:hypothetical protein
MAKRAHKRRPVQRSAWLVDHVSGRHCRCVMSDVSEGGARLELPAGINPPQIFALSLTETGKVLRFCEVRWRRGGAVGVRFVDASELKASRPADASAPMI